jgi:GNAT superfamily N-acetyltransferase
MRVLTVESPGSLDNLVAGSALAAPDPDILEHHRTDAHRVVLGKDGAPAARCSLWWQETPRYLRHRIGLIGHYSASDHRSAKRLLASACEELKQRGCTLAIGPMDGNTWRNYRFVTRPGKEAPFAMEPENPPSWPRHFRRAGFLTLATFTSAVTGQLDQPDPRLARAHGRFTRDGIRIRNLRPEEFPEELRRIHGVASISFQKSFLYTPIAEEEFLDQYRPIREALDPDLIFIAESDDRPVAFLFMVPDFSQAARGETVDTAILKTVAALPGNAHVGLGSFLVGHGQVRAHELGYRRVIHALMHDSNASMNISRKHATPMRRYSLFAKDLRASQ